MSHRVCLRCDWAGETDAESCPRCGVPLYMPAPAATVAARPVERHGRTERRAWRGRATVAAIAALAIAAFVVVQSLDTATPPSQASVVGRDGYLLVPASGPDGVRLWVWDLAAGSVAAGPRLDGVPTTTLESVSLNDSWIGLTMPMAGGSSAAEVLRGLAPTDRPVVVGAGDLVAWSAAGGYVSTARVRPLTRCLARLTIRTVFVRIVSVERSFAGYVCGDLVGLVRDRLTPFVSLQRRDRAQIALVTSGDLVFALAGRRLLSVSDDGDVLVARPGGDLELWRPPAAPRRIGGPAGFTAEAALGWRPDASEAYLLGRPRSGTRGVYRVAVGSAGPSRPELLVPTTAGDVSTTAGPGGVVYVLSAGVLRRWADGRATEVPLPPGLPPPIGPLLWVATLPYSPAGG